MRIGGGGFTGTGAGAEVELEKKLRFTWPNCQAESRGQCQHACDESRKRLRTDVYDGYQVLIQDRDVPVE